MSKDLNKHIILCFDWGYKNIGVATGNLLIETATPYKILSAKKGYIIGSDLWKLMNDWCPATIIIGVPTGPNNQELSTTKPAKRFVKHVKKILIDTEVEVLIADETRTTKDARAQLRMQDVKEERVDHISASLILERWMIECDNN